jgi:signal transduction histidine kinase
MESTELENPGPTRPEEQVRQAKISPMDLQTISLSVESAPDYLPFYHIPRSGKILKDLPAPFASDEVLAMARDRISLKHVTVRKDYALQDCQIALHRQKVKIALTNIIINALDAMPPEGGELRLITKSIGGKYTIRIEDNGCGISQANLANIFKPFFTNKPGGLGIGLATTYDILLSNHVGVTAESEEDVGTSFILLFDAHFNIGSFL